MMMPAIDDDDAPLKRRSRMKSSSSPNLPPTPKRPLSAYFHFCAVKRPEVAKSIKSLGDISKKLAPIWAETDAEGRKEFEEMAAAGKVEYMEKKAAWENECAKLAGKKKSNRATAGSMSGAVDKTKPKRPRSATAKRPEVAKRVKSLGEISKELARQWSETSDRSEFELLASADEKRCEEEMGKSQNSKDSSDSGAGLRPVNRSAKKSNSKPQRTPSAYMLSCREFRPSIVDDAGNKLPFGETAKRLAATRRECDDETKSKFLLLAEEEKEKSLASV